MTILREKRDIKMKIPKSEEHEIAEHYRDQHELLLKQRAAGITGFIDFRSYQ